MKRHNAGRKVLSSAPNPGFQNITHNAQNDYPQGQLTAYVPPTSAYPRPISNFSYTPIYDSLYGYNAHNNCNVNQFVLPPQPRATMVPPPPPNAHSVNTINAHSGSIGQHFGAFGPTSPQL